MNIVGHRGFPDRYPENSLIGIKEAILAGADAIEVDVQFNLDVQPYLLHDLSFARTSTALGDIIDASREHIEKISVHEPTRFGDCFHFCPVPHLKDIIKLLAQYPSVKLFIEIKEESLQRVSIDDAIAVLSSCVAAIRDRCIFISFSAEFIGKLKEKAEFSCGWILRDYSKKERLYALKISPDFLIVNWELAGRELFWPGPWQWFVYDTTDRAHAENLCARGAQWIETWNVEELLT